MQSAETAVRQARKIPRQRLVEGLRALYDADSALKAGSTEERAIMEFLVVRLTASGATDEPDGEPRSTSTIVT